MVADLINPIDRDALRQQFRNGEPVPWFKIDNFLHRDFAEQCASAFPGYDEVQKMGVSYTNVNERGKFQVTDLSVFPEPLKQLANALNCRDFIDIIEYATGIPKLLPDEQLVGGGLHATGPRGHLDVHLDFNMLKDRQLHRRLNILVYLNPAWSPQWGGEFELWDEKVKICQQKFLPTFNRCVVFETNEISFHGVNAVKCPPGEARKSFAAYYYTREAPAHYPGHAHSTVFRARPEEKFKKILMPAERNFYAARQLVRRGVSKLKKSVFG